MPLGKRFALAAAIPMDPFLYKDWLDQFQREVDDEVDRMRRAPTPAPPPPRPAAPEAAGGMRAWWEIGRAHV